MPYQIKEKAGQPYQPSNGMEGMMFMEQFCDDCEYLANCAIIPLSMIFRIGDKNYPKEWIHNDKGEPICTRFKKIKRKEAHGNTVKTQAKNTAGENSRIED